MKPFKIGYKLQGLRPSLTLADGRKLGWFRYTSALLSQILTYLRQNSPFYQVLSNWGTNMQDFLSFRYFHLSIGLYGPVLSWKSETQKVDLYPETARPILAKTTNTKAYEKKNCRRKRKPTLGELTPHPSNTHKKNKKTKKQMELSLI